VLEDFTFEVPKTREFVSLTKKLNISNKKLLMILLETNKNVYLSSRNLKSSEVITNSELNTYKILNANQVVFLEGALEEIELNLSK